MKKSHPWRLRPGTKPANLWQRKGSDESLHDPLFYELQALRSVAPIEQRVHTPVVDLDALKVDTGVGFDALPVDEAFARFTQGWDSED